MHSTGSYILTLLERVRAYLDEVELDAKFSNDWIVRHCIGPAQVDILARLSLTSGSPVIIQTDIAIAADTDYYVLPPCVQQVIRFTLVTDDDVPTYDALPRSIFHRHGSGWRIEGTPGAFRLVISGGNAMDLDGQIWYISNGDVHPHYGTGTLAAVSGVDRVTLSASPTYGALDRRDNAYNGQTLRILSASPAPIEERTITRSYYSGGSWYAEVATPFTHTADGSVTYEIAPAGSQSLYEAIAAWGAIKLGTARKISKSHQDALALQYRASLKTIGDNLTNIQGRVPQHIDKNTVDNPAYSEVSWVPLR